MMWVCERACFLSLLWSPRLFDTAQSRDREMVRVAFCHIFLLTACALCVMCTLYCTSSILDLRNAYALLVKRVKNVKGLENVELIVCVWLSLQRVRLHEWSLVTKKGCLLSTRSFRKRLWVFNKGNWQVRCGYPWVDIPSRRLSRSSRQRLEKSTRERRHNHRCQDEKRVGFVFLEKKLEIMVSLAFVSFWKRNWIFGKAMFHSLRWVFDSKEYPLVSQVFWVCPHTAGTRESRAGILSRFLHQLPFVNNN